MKFIFDSVWKLSQMTSYLSGKFELVFTQINFNFLIGKVLNS